MKVRIYSDGASRGNPGPSAIAFVIVSGEERVLKTYSTVIGTATNNQAEYMALIHALQFASELGAQSVACYLDSLLVVNHLKGVYRVRDAELRKLWLQIQHLIPLFQRVDFIHVSRETPWIRQVDQLANLALNEL